jgi:uncharacterized protein DUF6165
MKHFCLTLSLLLSGVALTSHQHSTALSCPCVSKTGKCECSINGECNCAEIYAREGSVPATCPCEKTDCCTNCCTVEQTPSENPVIEVSYGELFDKVTILEIKAREIQDEQKRSHAITELDILNQLVEGILEQQSAIQDELLILKNELGEINWRLWQVEDAIRAKETSQKFDAEFIQLARSVYGLNNARIVVKTKISRLLNSHIVEVKSYAWHTVNN